MGNFDRGRRGGGRGFGRSGGGRSFGGGRDFGQRGDREMHHAVCSNCGKDCEVPFKPTGSKPVLCSDCFSKNRDSEPRRFNDRGDRPQNNNKQLDVINAKLDQVLALLNGAPKGKAPRQVEDKASLPAGRSVKSVKSAKPMVMKTPRADVDGLDVSDILETPVTDVDPNNSVENTPAEE